MLMKIIFWVPNSLKPVSELDDGPCIGSHLENLSSESHSSRSAAAITALHGYHDHQQKSFHCLNVGTFLTRWPFAIYTTTSLSYLFSSYSHHTTSQTIPSFPSVPPACKSIVPKPIAHSRYLSHHILLIFFFKPTAYTSCNHTHCYPPAYTSTFHNAHACCHLFSLYPTYPSYPFSPTTHFLSVCMEPCVHGHPHPHVPHTHYPYLTPLCISIISITQHAYILLIMHLINPFFLIPFLLLTSPIVFPIILIIELTHLTSSHHFHTHLS